MRKLSVTPKTLKDLRSGGLLTGGFTLITAGIWNTFSPGVGMISGGVLLCTLQWWVDRAD
jgi:hypothetical protein